MGRKRWSRFPGLKKRRPFKTDDSHFSSGKPDRAEREEWADWHKGYKEKDSLKTYLAEIKNIPNCGADSLIRHWKKHKDRASFNLLMRAHLKRVPKIAYRMADEYGFKPSYKVIRDRKKARKGYEVVVAELICAGNLGLLETPKRFRLGAGASFATAAAKSIEKEIRKQALFLRHVVHVPEGRKCAWYKSLTAYDDHANEFHGETDVAVGGVAVSAYQLADCAADADPADPTVAGADLGQSIRDFACLTDLDRLTNKRERDIFRAHYIRGKTVKAIASKYGISFQQVSKIARAARDKILVMDFVIENVNLRATLPQWFALVEWLDALRRCNDVDLIRTRGRRAHIWVPRTREEIPDGVFVLPRRLDAANRFALWRLAEFEREDFNDPRWNRIVIAQLKIAEKKERWRKRKSDVDGLWDPLTPFFHPPEEDADHWGGIPIYSVTPPRLGPVIPALWTTRSTYPARIHVAPSPTKPQWIRPSKSWQFWPDFIERKRHLKPSMQLLERRSRPPYYVAGGRALWKKKLAPDDWRIKYQRERQEEFLLSTQPQQKEAA